MLVYSQYHGFGARITPGRISVENNAWIVAPQLLIIVVCEKMDRGTMKSHPTSYHEDSS
jgi:hypothetical protein